MNPLPKNKPCPECGRYDNRGVSVDAVIFRNGKVLLIKRGVEPYKGYWGTPGGYLEWDESAEETVIREVKEETHMDVEEVKLVNVSSAPGRHPKQVINIVYAVRVKDGEARSGDDTVDAAWFDLDALPEHMAFDHRQNIEDAQRMGM